MVKKIINPGERFGYLTYIKDADPVKYKDSKAKGGYSYRRRLLCKCDCGNEKVVRLSNLTNGHTKSCGCYSIKVSTQRLTKHGMNNHQLRSIYDAMRARCLNPKNASYKNYGGRGVNICHEWRVSYLKFLDWALANGWESKLTIDRIDNNGNYEPGNCRFVDRYTQANNTRSNVHIFVDGVKYSMAQFSRKYDIGVKYVKNRVKKGISGDMILVDYGLR